MSRRGDHASSGVCEGLGSCVKTRHVQQRGSLSPIFLLEVWVGLVVSDVSGKVVTIQATLLAVPCSASLRSFPPTPSSLLSSSKS